MIPGDLGGHCNARSSQSIKQTEGVVVQNKRDPYPVTAAVARTSLPAACISALPNSDVIDETAKRGWRTVRSIRCVCRNYQRIDRLNVVGQQTKKGNVSVVRST